MVKDGSNILKEKSTDFFLIWCKGWFTQCIEYHSAREELYNIHLYCSRGALQRQRK